MSPSPIPPGASRRVSGRFARSKAQRLPYDLALRSWQLLVLMAGVSAALGVGVLLLPVPNHQFVSGAFFVSGPLAIM